MGWGGVDVGELAVCLSVHLDGRPFAIERDRGAEELGAEQARAFVVGKLFAFTCFEGTTGMGRILSDGSVVGAVRIHGQGEPQFHRLPAGTVRIDGQFLCANVSALPFTPCARVEKIDYRSFRSSLVGLSFAYCDFYLAAIRSSVGGTSDFARFPPP